MSDEERMIAKPKAPRKLLKILYCHSLMRGNFAAAQMAKPGAKAPVPQPPLTRPSNSMEILD